ncbi:hypothetical protein D7I39_20325 [Allopusillimonas ginsengisoli]|nr:hypothetical protein D7I39_20325 [Allopusillimonas ginsengisoli]
MRLPGSWCRANQTNVSSTQAFALDVEATVCVTAEYRLGLHIDTGEANAAAIPQVADSLLMPTSCHAKLTVC